LFTPICPATKQYNLVPMKAMVWTCRPRDALAAFPWSRSVSWCLAMEISTARLALVAHERFSIYRPHCYAKCSTSLLTLLELEYSEQGLWNCRASICPSVCPSIPSFGRRMFLRQFAAVGPAAGDMVTVVIHTTAARPTVPSVNSRPSLVFCCSLHLLEHSTQRHSICTISFFLLPAAEGIPVSSILPWHYPLIFCTAHSWTSQQFRLF